MQHETDGELSQLMLAVGLGTGKGKGRRPPGAHDKRRRENVSKEERERRKAARKAASDERRLFLLRAIVATGLNYSAFSKLAAVNSTTLRAWASGKRWIPEASVGICQFVMLQWGLPVAPLPGALHSPKRSEHLQLRDTLPAGWHAHSGLRSIYGPSTDRVFVRVRRKNGRPQGSSSWRPQKIVDVPAAPLLHSERKQNQRITRGS